MIDEMNQEILEEEEIQNDSDLVSKFFSFHQTLELIGLTIIQRIDLVITAMAIVIRMVQMM